MKKFKQNKHVILFSSILFSLYLASNTININTKPKGKIILEKNFYDYEVTTYTNNIHKDLLKDFQQEKKEFIFPLNGTVTSSFNDIEDRTVPHEGIDIASDIGTKVKASTDGIITSAYYSKSYGWYISVLNDNVETIYAHNSKLLADKGDTVSQGDVIALSGNTGNSTGPHLHFEIKINGIHKDPALLCK